MEEVNSALAAESHSQLYKALSSSKARYPPVQEFASQLYYEEFKSIKEEKGVRMLNLHMN